MGREFIGKLQELVEYIYVSESKEKCYVRMYNIPEA
jgi:hypothetical protein